MSETYPILAEAHGAEYSVIGALLRNNELVSALEVEAEYFLQARSRTMFEQLVSSVRMGSRVDEQVLITRCNTVDPDIDGWVREFDKLLGVSTQPEAFSHYQQALKAQYTSAKARGIGRQLSESGDVSAALTALRGIAPEETKHGFDISALTQLYLHELENPTPAIPTGYAKLDAKLGGLHESDLIVIGARPSMGKTALACNLALNAGVPFVFFSGEQPAVQLMQRFISIMGGPPLWKVRNRTAAQGDMQGIADAVAMMKDVNPYVVDLPSPSLIDIVAESRKQAQERGAKLIIVDYLQRMRMPGKAQRREEISDAIRGLKELARELSVPVIVLAQVNRDVDTRQDPMPGMADLLESGAIEAEADQVLMLMRPYVYDVEKPKTLAVTGTVKNRHGPIGRAYLTFESETLRFLHRDGAAGQ